MREDAIQRVQNCIRYQEETGDLLTDPEIMELCDCSFEELVEGFRREM